MTRCADTLCSGGCGRLLWRGRGSRPDPVCRECRSQGNGPRSRSGGSTAGFWICERCGEKFRRYRSKSQAEPRFCTWSCWTNRELAGKNRESGRRRRAVVTSTWDGVTDRQIFERDEWRCLIPGCGGPIEPDLTWPDPYSPSIDHIVPLSRGGTHVASNKRAAHLRCNVSRGARMHPEDVQIITSALAPLGVFPPPSRSVKTKNICLTCDNVVSSSGTSCRSCQKAARRQQAVALRAQGMKWADIAIQLGMSGSGAACNLASGRF